MYVLCYKDFFPHPNAKTTSLLFFLFIVKLERNSRRWSTTLLIVVGVPLDLRVYHQQALASLDTWLPCRTNWPVSPLSMWTNARCVLWFGERNWLLNIILFSQPKKCRQECKRNCPVVRMGAFICLLVPKYAYLSAFSSGKLCIEVGPTSKLAMISEAVS